uniref:Uncharacterized protein n=1 Tax=Caenorhabditis japonica TaxID=281687 RepID=A0A8R1DIX4_CAEJA
MNSHLFHLIVLLSSSLLLVLADYCGSDQIAYGMEVHHSGVIRLLCSKPNCFDKNYSECPERAESTGGCVEANQWIGGFETNIEGELTTMCCEFENLYKFAKVRYSDVRIRRGEFFEGEEKENDDGDVIKFDAIKDIRMHKDSEGQRYYNLTILSFDCEAIPDVKPAWYQKSQWPYFQYAKI